MKTLNAKAFAVAGGSEEERKAERLSKPTRSILDAPGTALKSRLVFIALSWPTMRDGQFYDQWISDRTMLTLRAVLQRCTS